MTIICFCTAFPELSQKYNHPGRLCFYLWNREPNDLAKVLREERMMVYKAIQKLCETEVYCLKLASASSVDYYHVPSSKHFSLNSQQLTCYPVSPNKFSFTLTITWFLVLVSIFALLTFFFLLFFIYLKYHQWIQYLGCLGWEGQPHSGNGELGFHADPGLNQTQKSPRYLLSAWDMTPMDTKN